MDEQVSRTEFDPGTVAPPQPVRQRSRRGRWLLLLLPLVLIGLGAWLVLTQHPAPHGRPGIGAENAPQPVGAATIEPGTIRIILNELGTVTPLDTVTVMTQINGQLTAVGFQEGQMVKKGDFLAQIDDRPYVATLERDQGQLAHDQGLLAQAQADLQRFATLGRQNSIAPQQVEDQRFLVQQDEGTVKADEGTVANDKINIAYCHIVSPIDGRIGLRVVDPGNYVTTSSTAGIAVITQMQPMSALFSVPQEDLSEIEAQMAKDQKLTVDAYDQGNTTEIDQGQLETLDNEIDTSTGTVKLRAIFPNTKSQLFPNQFVNAHLLVDTLTNVVRVPVAAVQVGEPGSFVWLINQNGTVTSTPVKLGPIDGQYQQVISGLKAGDRVVTDGSDRLRDGMKVVEPTARSSATSPTTAAAAAQQNERHGPRGNHAHRRPEGQPAQ
jgi:membrane fusion protein, multidrug efflux system